MSGTSEEEKVSYIMAAATSALVVIAALRACMLQVLHAVQTGNHEAAGAEPPPLGRGLRTAELLFRMMGTPTHAPPQLNRREVEQLRATTPSISPARQAGGMNASVQIEIPSPPPSPEGEITAAPVRPLALAVRKGDGPGPVLNLDSPATKTISIPEPAAPPARWGPEDKAAIRQTVAEKIDECLEDESFLLAVEITMRERDRKRKQQSDDTSDTSMKLRNMFNTLGDRGLYSPPNMTALHRMLDEARTAEGALAKTTAEAEKTLAEAETARVEAARAKLELACFRDYP